MRVYLGFIDRVAAVVESFALGRRNLSVAASPGPDMRYVTEVRPLFGNEGPARQRRRLAVRTRCDPSASHDPPFA